MLFVGDDCAKDHHDVVLVDENGKRLAYRRLPAFGSPGAALLERPEPGLDEGLRLWVALAATTVGDAARGEVFAELAAMNCEPLSLPRASRRGGTARS
jgi:hypothetical protein